MVQSTSKDKPHFTGKSYVRVGAETVEASAEVLGQLLDQRNSLLAALTPHVGKKVTVFAQQQDSAGRTRWDGRHQEATLVALTPHYVHIRFDRSTPDKAVSLGRLALE